MLRFILLLCLALTTESSYSSDEAKSGLLKGATVSNQGGLNLQHTLGQVSLSYNSNGGWQMRAGGVILRQSDMFGQEVAFTLNGEALVADGDGVNPRRFRLPSQPRLQVYYYNENEPNLSFWRVDDALGNREYFRTRSANPYDDSKIYRWLLTKREDALDATEVFYHYDNDESFGGFYLTDIVSGRKNCSSNGYVTTKLNYEDIPAHLHSQSYATGAKVQFRKRAASVEYWMGTNQDGEITPSSHMKWRWQLDYTESTDGFSMGISRLSLEGQDESLGASGDVNFTYHDGSQLPKFADVQTFTDPSDGDGDTTKMFLDVNGDGIIDRVTLKGLWVKVNLGKYSKDETEEDASPKFKFTKEPDWQDEEGNKEFGCQYLDMDGDGSLDCVYKEGQNLLFRSLGERGFGEAISWETQDDDTLKSAVNEGHRGGLLDFNGDGRPDRVLLKGGSLSVQLNHGDGFGPVKTLLAPDDATVLKSGDSHGNITTTYIDMNGDGLMDRVVKEQGGDLKVRYNIGTGFTAEETFTLGDSHALYSLRGESVLSSLMDINRDGLVDRVFSANGSLKVSFNQGTTFTSEAFSLPDAFGDKIQDANKCQCLSFTDFNGDGLMDRVLVQDKKILVWQQEASLGFKLKTIKNTFGGTQTFTYQHPDFMGQKGVPTWVLQSETRDSGFPRHGDATTKSYSFGEEIFKDGRFAGFGSHTTTTQSGIKTIQTFYPEGIAEGLPRDLTTYGADGSKYEVLTKTYKPFTPMGSTSSDNYAVLESERRSLYDGKETPVVHLETTYDYDKYGFLIQTHNRGRIAEDGSDPYNDNRIVRNKFINLPSKGVFGLLKEESFWGVDTSNPDACVDVEDQDCFQLQKLERIFYDDLPYGQATKGIETKRIRKVGETWESLGHRTYDEHGNVVKESLNGLTSEITYDSDFCYLAEKKVVTHDSQVDDYVVSSATYNNQHQVETETNSQGTTTYFYDSFSRPEGVSKPGESASTATNARTYLKPSHNRPGGYVDAFTPQTQAKYTYTDGMGRVIQQKIRHQANDTWITTDRFYRVTANGETVVEVAKDYPTHTSAYTPPVAASTAKKTSVYTGNCKECGDGGMTGRVTATTTPLGRQSYTVAVGLDLHSFDHNGALRMVQRKNGLGQVVESTEFGLLGDQDTTLTMDYYTAIDKPRSITSPDYQARLLYNMAGHRIAMVDNISGYQVFRYTLQGKQNLVVDGKNRVTLVEFDGFGRPMTKKYGDLKTGVLDAQKVDEIMALPIKDVPARLIEDSQIKLMPLSQGISYAYNESGHNASQELLTTITYPHGEDKAYYDDKGRVSRATRSFLGAPEVFETKYEYNAHDKLASVSLPNGSTLVYDYIGAYPVGVYLKTKDGAKTLVKDMTFDEAGVMDGFTFGNGIKSSFAFARDEKGFHKPQLQSMTARLGDQTIWSHKMTYNDRGFVVAIETPAFTNTYSYDSFGRISSENSKPFQYSPSGSIEVFKGLPVVGKEYDDLGQLIKKRGPNNGTAIQEYFYDRDSNLVAVMSDGQTLMEAAYDATGKRIAKTEGDVTTYYISPGYYQTYKDDKLVSTSLEVTLSGQKLATVKSGKTYYHHNDHKGSTNKLTDASGQLVASFAFDAFGNRLYAKDTSGNDIQDPQILTMALYSGVSLDESTGLYLFKARYLDPEMGAFITPDTMVPGSNAQSLNRYGFNFNNPLSYSDPSGHVVFLAPLMAFLATAGKAIAATGTAIANLTPKIALGVAVASGVGGAISSIVGEVMNNRDAKIAGMILAGVSLVTGGLSGSLNYGIWAKTAQHVTLLQKAKSWLYYGGNLLAQGLMSAGATYVVKGFRASIDTNESINWRTSTMEASISMAFAFLLGAAWDSLEIGVTGFLTHAINKSSGWFKTALTNIKTGFDKPFASSLWSLRTTAGGFGTKVSTAVLQIGGGILRSGLFHVMSSAAFTPAFTIISYLSGDCNYWEEGIEANWGLDVQKVWLGFTFGRATVMRPSGTGPVFNSLGAVGDVIGQYYSFKAMD